MASLRYALEYPLGVDVDPAYVSFLSNFYRLSDIPTAHEAYAAQFADDATLIMASTKAVGREAIQTLRESIWESVVRRTHLPRAVYPFGEAADSIMLHGTVDYELREGRTVRGVEWAARGTLQKDASGRVRWRFYQVYLDTATQRATGLVGESI